jgi:UDP-N-acetyl-D-mannosaminuronic acid transferase (WecB/TagA/CpsF family)
MDNLELSPLSLPPERYWLKTYVQKVNAVTPADVQKMMVQYIKPEQMAIVVVGDKAKITEQLAPYAATGGSNK